MPPLIIIFIFYQPNFWLATIKIAGTIKKTNRIYIATYILFFTAASASFSAAIRGISLKNGIPYIKITPRRLYTNELMLFEEQRSR